MALTDKQKNMQSLIDMMKDLQGQYRDNLSNEKQIAELQQVRSDRQMTINELQRNYNELTKSQKDYLNDIIKQQNEEYITLRNLTKEQKSYNDNLAKSKKLYQEIGGLAKNLWTYLNQNDKIIRSTILNLGISGAKAEIMRSSFEQSAVFVAKLGGDLGDIQTIMTGYADETGRARALSAEMVKDIELIGKGTGLGIESATRLGAQFELMGYDAKTTMEYVQGVVDTSERMGVNTTKVLKNIGDNFKKLQTYTFQQGVKGFAQMAMYAEKFKIDIGAALDSATVARSLEGAIDLAAQLQVMGGEFAKTDPFQMLFLSRNDPAKFTEKIADMTKGVVTFRKMADGSFEKFISPADRDRLASVAKSLGMSNEQLTEMSLRQAEIQRMRQQMSGMGLSSEQKDLIEGAAVFNAKTGRFEAMIAGQMRDVTTLTSAQADKFIEERKSLEERAKQAQTFDEAFKATINELKAVLLPMLRGVDAVLKSVRPIAETVTKAIEAFSQKEWMATGLKVAGGILAGGFILNKAFMAGAKIFGSSKGAAGLGGLIRSKLGGGTSGRIPTSGGAGAAPSFGSGAGAGMKSLGAGAGIGLAAVGMGEGVGLAATGISKLADSMSKLTPEQAKTLKSIAMTLAITFPLAAIGIGIVAAVAAPAAVPLLALGAALLMMGGAIGIASWGIGQMGMGLGKLVESSKDAGPAMLQVGAGIGFIAASMLGFTAGAAGFLVFAGVMRTLAKNAPAMAVVGNAFKEIRTVMTGAKEDLLAVQQTVASLSKLNVKGGGMFSELANILSKPLKVEFTQGRVAMVNEITLTLDGQKFMQKSYNVNLAIQKHQSLMHGKGDQNT
jgi:hypothetical protein